MRSRRHRPVRLHDVAGRGESRVATVGSDAVSARRVPDYYIVHRPPRTALSA